MAKKRHHSLDRRNAGKRPTRDRILIITEGETERAYFEALRRYYRIPAVECRVMPSGKGTSPKNIVDYAESLLLNAFTNNQRLLFPPKAFEKVFVVFDEDNDPLARITAIKRIKELSGKYRTQEKQNIEFTAVDSIPNFELWFLLHFEYLYPQKMLPLDSIERLKRYVPDYVKPMSTMFDKTKDQIFLAVKRAEKLLADDSWQKGDICTNVHLSVKALLQSETG